MSFRPARRHVLAGAGALAATRVWADPASPGVVRVTLQTGQGPIVLELAGDRAPISVANFLRYVDTHRYDGSSFYRAVKAPGAPQFGLVQAGIRDGAKLLPPIAHESTLKTGILHKDGTISLARREQGTARSDFFVCVGDASYLDADPKAPGDNAGFAAFGHVVEGMDVVRKILALPVSPTAGAPEMAGQMLEPAVPIVTARRSPMPAPAAAPPAAPVTPNPAAPPPAAKP
ncbi:MAG TPA: peptidylprolyl isomerase [Caulobacteraceae bacterium]|nr:peptidylprolyl isomerase [Caulobacteraceae bacterium]